MPAFDPRGAMRAAAERNLDCTILIAVEAAKKGAIQLS